MLHKVLSFMWFALIIVVNMDRVGAKSRLRSLLRHDLAPPYNFYNIHAAIALLATTVMPILLLQKPAFNASCLERRLKLWFEGDINALVLEGRCLQKHLRKSAQHQRNNHSISGRFANLMFTGKIEAALGRRPAHYRPLRPN